MDTGLAADKFPSETDAWASSRVLTKLRQVSLSEPQEPASAAQAAIDLSSSILPLQIENAPRRAPPKVDETLPAAEPLSIDVVPVSQRESGPRTLIPHGSNILSLLTELNALVGLQSVKEQVETLVNLAKVRSLRTERGLPSPTVSFHLVFSGNPGTGKTTVARILGRIYGSLGLLSLGKCVEVDRSSLVGQYLGQTTAKTAEMLTNSLGSVLFIDEAYSLTVGDANEYGNEAISVILKFMEDNRDNFVLIAAGYTQEMETFLSSNPGLRSRFSGVIEFPDYDVEELVQIFDRMCSADGYILERDAQPQVRQALESLLDPKPAEFANAREVRKIYERAIERHANRIAGTSCSNEELSLLRHEDIPLKTW